MIRGETGGGPSGISCAVLAITVFLSSAYGKYGGGSGTADDPYRILTAQQLGSIGAAPEDWDKHFRLVADIDLADRTPGEMGIIGTASDRPFTGVFDGGGRVISQFYHRSEADSYVGLFGLVEGRQAQIMHLTLIGPNVVSEAGRYVAPLVGYLHEGTVSDCHVHSGSAAGAGFVGGMVGRSDGGLLAGCTVVGTVAGATRVGGLIGENYCGTAVRNHARGEVLGIPEPSCWSIGGLVGENDTAIVADSSAACIVTGDRCIGGLVGDNIVAEVRCCYAAGAVSGSSDVGGLAGSNRGGVVADCYSLAEVSGGLAIGGLVGRNAPSCYCSGGTPGSIARCYAAGPVTSLVTPAGLLALNENGDVADCFWDIEATGCTVSAAGTPRATSEMRDLTVYSNAGWDFIGESANGTEDVWCMRAVGHYPRLTWQIVPGDLDDDGNVDLRDYGMLTRLWRQKDSDFWSGGTDLTGDGINGFADLQDLATHWLAGCE